MVALLIAAALAAGSPSLKIEPLAVKGAVLTQGGREVRLRGVNIASLEWTSTGENVLKSIAAACDDWKAGCIRLPVSQDRWFGRAPEQTDRGAAYRALVDQAIAETARRKVWLVLDLHWSNAGVWGQKIGQHCMPDMNSVEFWKDAARRFRNSPTVLFDLYNEPHDVSWKAWRDGGEVVEKAWGGGESRYKSPGMQGLLDAVRSTGAKNAVVAGGLDWAYDLSGVVEGYALKERGGRGVIYSAHIYPVKKQWDEKVGRAAATAPVLVGEVGCEPAPGLDPLKWGAEVLDWIEAKKLHWTAWDFHPSAAPRLIKGWTYEPTDFWGVEVKKRLSAARG